MDNAATFERPDMCRRAAPRTNLFVMATLVSDTMSGAVRVRNLSESGALIEANNLPDAGATCRLIRGNLSVPGKVTRRSEKNIGFQFERRVSVESWMKSGHEHQQQVDRIVQQAKHVYPVADKAHIASHTLKSTVGERNDLHQIADKLDKLADLLSNDPEVIARYMNQLQVLDLASQKLRALG